MKTIVHTTQAVYRQLVNITSRPGHIELIEEEVKNYSDFSNATLLTTMTLFDNEISFITPDGGMDKEIKVLTGATSIDSLKETDFIVLKATDLKEEYFTETAHGVLISPEKSVTLIIEVDSVTSGQSYTFSGPGIKDETKVNITLEHEWISLRNEVCKEFPLGLDIILTDKENQAMMIPRTTKVEVA
ncbi:phosphonate C-P lyase system protein PhnH [Jeotgalicoccus huakuii]|nr:phosphonate C-P lyase system protein PhnH [Jeotgalicoccus huakuii]